MRWKPGACGSGVGRKSCQVPRSTAGQRHMAVGLGNWEHSGHRTCGACAGPAGIARLPRHAAPLTRGGRVAPVGTVLAKLCGRKARCGGRSQCDRPRATAAGLSRRTRQIWVLPCIGMHSPTHSRHAEVGTVGNEQKMTNGANMEGYQTAERRLE